MHEAVITLLKSLVTFYPNPRNGVGVLIAEAFWRFFSRSKSIPSRMKKDACRLVLHWRWGQSGDVLIKSLQARLAAQTFRFRFL